MTVVTSEPELDAGPGERVEGPAVLELENISKSFQRPRRRALLAEVRARLGGDRDDVDDDDDDDVDEDDDQPVRRGQADWALRDIRLRLQPGARLGVVGPISSGKTTLVRIVAGLSTPNSGRIVRRGRVVPLLDSLTLLLQDTNGRRNVVLLARLLGIPPGLVRAEMREIFEFAELSGRESGGRKSFDRDELRRLVVATALRIDGELILLDSELGDPGSAFQQRCLETLDERLAAGCALIQTGREPSAVRRYCDDVIWLENGTIAHRGPNEEVARAVREQRAAARPTEAPPATTEALRFAEFLHVALGDERAADALAAATERAVAEGAEDVGWPAVAEAVGYDLDTAREIVARLEVHEIRASPSGAGQSEHASIVSARLTRANGRTTTAIRTDEEARLEVTATVARGNLELGCLVYLNGLDGGRLLLEYPDPLRVDRPRTVRFTTTIPGGSLASSGYRGTVVLPLRVGGRDVSVHRDDLLSFTVGTPPDEAVEANALDALEPFLPGEEEDPSFERARDLEWHVDVEAP